MGHHNHCGAFFGKLRQNIHHFTGQFRIKCRSRLVAEQNFRRRSQCTGNRNTLLLTTGEGCRPCISLLRQADLFKQLLCPFPRLFLRPFLNCNQTFSDVLGDCTMRKQLKILKDHAGMAADQVDFFLADFAFRGKTQPVTRNFNIAGSRHFQQIETAQQCAFTGAGRPDKGCHTALGNRQGDIVEHGMVAEFFYDIFEFDHHERTSRKPP